MAMWLGHGALYKKAHKSFIPQSTSRILCIISHLVSQYHMGKYPTHDHSPQKTQQFSMHLQCPTLLYLRMPPTILLYEFPNLFQPFYNTNYMAFHHTSYVPYVNPIYGPIPYPFHATNLEFVFLPSQNHLEFLI
eukprot:c24432_g1_i1 orf=323-724(-)